MRLFDSSHIFPRGKSSSGKNARGVEQGNARRIVDERRRRGVGSMGPGGSVRMPARSARWKLLQTHAGAMGCTPGRTPWILDFSNGYASTLGVPERPQVFPSASGGGSRSPPSNGYSTCLETSTCFRYILPLAVTRSQSLAQKKSRKPIFRIFSGLVRHPWTRARFSARLAVHTGRPFLATCSHKDGGRRMP